MRKSFLLILVFLLLTFCASAFAETEIALEGISGKIAFNDDLYVVLTPDNLAEHPDLLSSIGKSQEELLADWTARGVLLQAWSKGTNKRTSVEVAVLQDDASARYYDLEQQNGSTRNQYYKEQLASYREQGYVIDNAHAELKLHSKSGHYVTFEYVLHEGDLTRRGIIRKTVRNGYTLFMNYEVYDRRIQGTDRDRSRKLVNSITIDTIALTSSSGSTQSQTVTSAEPGAAVPADASGLLNITVAPPEKTNDGVFTVEGTAYPGSEVIVVAMRWSQTTSPYRFPVTATKAGNFKAKVTLPEEGLYQLTVGMYINDSIIADAVLNSVTYSRTVLPYTLDAEIPELLTSDELVISGTTVKAVTIQCIVTNGISTFDKTIRTNGTGKFRFKIPTKDEAEYNITLVFSKKNLNTERISLKASRNLTVQDNQNRTAAKAIHPAYAALVKNLNSYIGQTMVYEVHITDVSQVDDEWVLTTAQKLNKGTYSNFLVFMAKEDPGLAVGSKVKLYGTCIGAYQVQSEEESTSYPGFDYLFFE